MDKERAVGKLDEGIGRIVLAQAAMGGQMDKPSVPRLPEKHAARRREIGIPEWAAGEIFGDLHEIRRGGSGSAEAGPYAVAYASCRVGQAQLITCCRSAEPWRKFCVTSS